MKKPPNRSKPWACALFAVLIMPATALAQSGGQAEPKDVSDLRKAAEQGDVESQRALAFNYQIGFHVKKNDAEAINWYRKAAEQGNFLATSNLFTYCKGGKITKQDCADVAKWLRAFANRDDARAAEAQCDLGDLLETGLGVYQNYAEAAQMYQRCAAPGNWQGQWRLGVLYHDGKGVPQDFVLAYMWMSLAAAGTSNTFDQLQAEFAKLRDDIASKMTRDQIAEAQRLAREWKPAKAK
jgi:hypothetical protein